jgi:hypothetical protein
VASIETLDPVVRVDEPAGRSIWVKRRVLYTVTTVALSLVLGFAVLDAGPLDVYGVDTATASDRADGVELDVRYGSVSRPGLATPFEITVRAEEGFSSSVRIAVDADYLSIWDENGLDPDPSEATQDESVVIWEFEPPDGDTLVVSLDGRIEPSIQTGKSGRVSVLDPDGQPIVTVTFSTRVLP